MDNVRGHLQCLLASDAFRRAPHASTLLSYLVESALAESVPKEYVIATEALGRSTDFDPRTDPVVRVEIRRLRQKLLEYYAEDGRDSDLVFELPKGRYGLTWRHRQRSEQPLSIAVLPLENLTGDASKEYFVDGLTEELTSTENKVAFARQAFNDSVMAYNNKREVFPSSIFAGMFNFADVLAMATPKGIAALERGRRQRPYPHTVAAPADAPGLTGAPREEFVGALGRPAPVAAAPVPPAPDPPPRPARPPPSTASGPPSATGRGPGPFPARPGREGGGAWHVLAGCFPALALASLPEWSAAELTSVTKRTYVISARLRLRQGAPANRVACRLLVSAACRLHHRMAFSVGLARDSATRSIKRQQITWTCDELVLLSIGADELRDLVRPDGLHQPLR